ncbi:hypothetical protein GGD81_002831 [Rhodobium orientis]|uniref:UPF0260 protein CH339_15485 n=1 Tax=Rhodobium orientis TaxID=34017 RepID=A0A327JRW9_9HYPH|nr:YcgN family cysteine cluster protein [Rhodobium orientis]MBB4303779.1 hypothetical protein [Rhodobium orientis]MBK5947898.1 hypothetical protein [Rhodobium orientis]RAI26108.1 hypothetical protein CH339_15485 [Rhodobium orientis]
MAVSDVSAAEIPFWEAKALEEMSRAEWESLCDGCGRCCLNKLEDYDTGEIAWTDVACTLLDDKTCRCRDYENRTKVIPDCVPLDAATVRTIAWLPPTCAYRLIAEDRDLYWWHPLLSGDPDTVKLAGISVEGKVISEDEIPVEDYEDRVVTWPEEEG